MNHTLNIDELKMLFQYYNYKFFEKDNFNLNIIGFRNCVKKAGLFDDQLYLVYKDKNEWVTKTYPITTDPGRYWLRNPMKEKGCAILAPGQYSGMWEIGKHRGQYEALVQDRDCTVFRDNNKDDYIDTIPNITETGRFGINMHRTRESMNEKSSAGCQVFANINHFNDVMETANIAAQKWGNSFTYTLFTTLQALEAVYVG